MVQTTSVAMIPMGTSRFGFLHSSAAVETESNPMYVKKMIDPPVRMPGQPFGAKGCQFAGCTMRDAKITKTMMAVIFSATITVFTFADSRIPRTSSTVNNITMINAGQLNPKCQPGAYKAFPCRSESPEGRYAGVIQRKSGCTPNQSSKFTTCAENPTLTAIFETAYSRIKSQPMIQAISSPIVA